MTTTNIDKGSVILADPHFRDALLTFGAADTFVPGTLLARLAALSVSAGTVQGGTGTGTISLVSIVEGPVVPLVGVYKLTCIEAVAHGGVFQLTDPNGAVVAAYLPMNTTTGAAKAFEVAGLAFTLTDATDFIVGNYFDITVVTGAGKLVPFNPAGVGGAQFPKAVLTYEVSKASSGDLPIRALVGGEVNKNRLIIDADGTGANITEAILDQLRAVGIQATNVKQLSAYDNQ
jgi:hypothetical protein